MATFGDIFDRKDESQAFSEKSNKINILSLEITIHYGSVGI